MKQNISKEIYYVQDIIDNFNRLYFVKLNSKFFVYKSEKLIETEFIGTINLYQKTWRLVFQDTFEILTEEEYIYLKLLLS